MNKAEKATVKAQFDDEKKCLEELKKAYKKAKKDVQAKLKALNSRTDMQNLQTIIHQRKYQEALLKQIDGVLNDLETHTYDSANEFFQGSYQNGYIGSMYELMNQGIPLTIPVSTQKMFRAIQTDSKLSTKYYLGKGLTVQNIRTLKKQIATEATRGIASGKSWLEVADDLTIQRYFQISQSDAIRIVRTEGNRINQQARLDAGDDAIQNGCDLLKQWDATLDSRTRQAHREADGQIVEWDEDFTVMGEKLKAPSIGGSASNVINCRCQLLKRPRWALDEEELEVLKKRAEYYKLDKNQSFEEFKEKYLNLPDNADKTVLGVESVDEINKQIEDLQKQKDLKRKELVDLEVDERYGNYRENKIKEVNDNYLDLANLSDEDLKKLKDLSDNAEKYSDEWGRLNNELSNIRSTRPRTSDFVSEKDYDEAFEKYLQRKKELQNQVDLYSKLTNEAYDAKSKLNRYKTYQDYLRKAKTNYRTHQDLLNEIEKIKKEIDSVDVEIASLRERIIQTASVKQDIRITTTKLKSVMDSDIYDEYINLIQSNSDIAPLYKHADNLREVVYKDGEGCFYNSGKLEFSYPTQHLIDDGMSKYHTIAHEYGHYVDTFARDDKKFDASIITWSEMDTIKQKVGAKYASGLTEHVLSNSDQFLTAVRKDFKTNFSNKEYVDYCLNKRNTTTGIQDAVDGWGLGRIRWGHGDKYYNRAYNKLKDWEKWSSAKPTKSLQEAYKELGFDASNQAKVKRRTRQYETASELWANMISAETTGGEELETIKKMFPEAYKVMKELLKGVK